jgi:hypothetical protein
VRKAVNVPGLVPNDCDTGSDSSEFPIERRGGRLTWFLSGYSDEPLPVYGFTAAEIPGRVYRVKCPACGVKIEKVPLLPGKAPFSRRFEDAVGLSCESAAARQVARRLGLAESPVRAIDLRYLERWDAKRRSPPLHQTGVDELYRGKKDKFLRVACNLETGEPLWFGEERKKETLDEFFRGGLVSRQRKRIEAACADMWEPFRLSIEQWAPNCRIAYDEFHIMQYANDAIGEVRRAEFFRQGRKKRGLIKGKKWLLQSRWKNLTCEARGGDISSMLARRVLNKLKLDLPAQPPPRITTDPAVRAPAVAAR